MPDDIGPLTIAQVDTLLDELALTCHSSALRQAMGPHARPKPSVLRALYNSLPPSDAAFLTQIILKDLSPVLYPVEESHYTVALKQFRGTAVRMLTLGDAMKAWDTSGYMWTVYRVRSSLEEVSKAFERRDPSTDPAPLLGIPVEASNHCRWWSPTLLIQASRFPSV
jgi:DNA ligase 4